MGRRATRRRGRRGEPAEASIGWACANLNAGDPNAWTTPRAIIWPTASTTASRDDGLPRLVNEVRNAKPGYGLNAATNQVVDLVAEGIIDPAMVTRSALQNAASIAKNILTTEAIVAELPEKEGAAGGGGMPDMSGMM